MVHDVIGDMLVKLKNAAFAGKKTVKVRYSKLKLSLLEKIKEEGYIDNIQVIEEDNNPNKKSIVVDLRFYNKKPVITSIKRVSKPGRRVYAGVNDIPRVMNGLGVTILSTSKGVLIGKEAKKLNIGGEIICVIV